MTVQTYAAGRISGSGGDLKTVYRDSARPQKAVTLKVPLLERRRSSAGR